MMNEEGRELDSSRKVSNRRRMQLDLDSKCGKKNQEKVDGCDDLKLEKNEIENEAKKNLRTRKTHGDESIKITVGEMVFALIPY